MTIREVTDHLESIAPKAYQEGYDNSGLITGSPESEVKGILITLDCIEAVVDEAIKSGCNLIIAHHPIIFKGLKRLTGSTYVERTVIKALQNNVAIYAIHTNLDNVASGVNKKLAEKIGLERLEILAPKSDALTKLVTFIPVADAPTVHQALYAAGAGEIGNYSDCSFSVEGTGTFRPNEEANPTVGSAGKLERVNEIRSELIFPSFKEKQIIAALKKAHPYEEVAYYLTRLVNDNQEVGSGMIGYLPEPLEPMDFLKRLKINMDLQVIRYTRPQARSIEKVAVCGGAGSFLLPRAIQSGAQAFITADFKYHEFFDADDKIMVVDIGHYESEVFTKELIMEVLRKKFPTFAINFSRTVTNPISYL